MIDFYDIEIEEYPYDGGEFYTVVTTDGSPLNQESTEKSVLTTKYDIQKSNKLHTSTLLGANYTVFFPMTGDIPVRRGMRFRGISQGLPIDGEVEGVWPSQLGGCSCDLKVITEDVV